MFSFKAAIAVNLIADDRKSIFRTSFHIKHFIAGRTQANYIKPLMIF